ncbi:MAG: pentapeptide repeat-containing protein [Candidatus Berkiellales bacterium]
MSTNKVNDNDLLKEGKHNYLNEHFKDLDLSGKEIIFKVFENCIFLGCNFCETIFNKCKFYECTFTRCNLSVAKVTNCSFFDTVFDESKVIGINWTTAAWSRLKLSSPISFNKCVLNDSSFIGLCLKEIAIVECKAHDVDFREADCEKANFTYTDFTHSLFNKTNLSEADFTEATNYQINLFHNETKKAKFTMPEATNLLRCLDIEIVD